MFPKLHAFSYAVSDAFANSICITIGFSKFITIGDAIFDPESASLIKSKFNPECNSIFQAKFETVEHTVINPKFNAKHKTLDHSVFNSIIYSIDKTIIYAIEFTKLNSISVSFNYSEWDTNTLAKCNSFSISIGKA
jgi:hypothetical protein